MKKKKKENDWTTGLVHMKCRNDEIGRDLRELCMLWDVCLHGEALEVVYGIRDSRWQWELYCDVLRRKDELHST